MKILLLGDASNYHHTLSLALGKRGHDVTIASHGSRWMGTARDIDLSRGDDKIGGAILWLKLNTLLWPQLKGYDVVHISGVGFIEQKPQRIQAFFDKVRRANGSVFLTALATDSQYVDMCTCANSPLRYTEWAVDGRPTPYALAYSQRLNDWKAPALSRLSEHIYGNVHGIATALYEYHLSAQRYISRTGLSIPVEYAGIPIVTDEMPPIVSKEDAPVEILWACHRGRETEKGADILLNALTEVVDQSRGMARLNVAQNVPLRQFERMLAQADIVVDQLYSYTPATTALMAMAKGKVVISGGEPEYYDFIGESNLRPIINADPQNISSLKEQVRTMINDRGLLTQAARQSRELVLKHNSADVVAARVEKLWDKALTTGGS